MVRGQRGFTLIELLVVIGIIVILAAILFPVFGRARAKAQQTSCLANVKSIGMAMMMYSSDFDNRLPLVRGPLVGPSYLGSWIDLLQPYVKNTQVFICPASSYDSTDWRSNNNLLLNYGYPPVAAAFVTGPDPLYSLISFNGTARYDGLGGYGDGPLGMYRRPCRSKLTTSLERSGELVLVSDHSFYDWGVQTGAVYYPAIRHMSEGMRGGVTRGQVNCCFADGHAKALQHEQYWEVRDINSVKHGPVRVYWHFWPYD